jgi:hypothetical protein
MRQSWTEGRKGTQHTLAIGQSMSYYVVLGLEEAYKMGYDPCFSHSRDARFRPLPSGHHYRLLIPRLNLPLI